MHGYVARAGCLAALLLGIAASAQAGITYDFQFRSTDLAGNPIAGGAPVGGGHSFSFTSPSAANANPGIVMDVLLRTTDPLFAASVSVVWDNSSGLVTSSAQEWFGQGVLFNMMQAFVSFAPLGGLSCGANSCESFDGVIVPPNGPPSLPVGTYNIGTIVWDTSAVTASSIAVMTQVISGVDGTGGVVGGSKVNLTGTEVVEMGFINFDLVPEPGTAALLLFGLGGLGVWVRRRPK